MSAQSLNRRNKSELRRLNCTYFEKLASFRATTIKCGLITLAHLWLKRNQTFSRFLLPIHKVIMNYNFFICLHVSIYCLLYIIYQPINLDKNCLNWKSLFCNWSATECHRSILDLIFPGIEMIYFLGFKGNETDIII